MGRYLRSREERSSSDLTVMGKCLQMAIRQGDGARRSLPVRYVLGEPSE